MKKIIIVIFLTALCFFAVLGCSKNNSTTMEANSSSISDDEINEKLKEARRVVTKKSMERKQERFKSKLQSED